MENYTIIDVISLLIVIISGLLAFTRGISREILSIVSWIFSAIIAFFISPLIHPFFNEIPILKEIIYESCELSILISFALTFIIFLVVISFFIPLISNFIQRSSLSSIDRVLGFMFGVLRGCLLITIALILHDVITNENNSLDVIKNSETEKLFSQMKENILLYIPKNIPDWTAKKYETLIFSCNYIEKT